MLMLGRQSGRIQGYDGAADLFRRRYGIGKYVELDLFSERASLRLDLNDDLVGLSACYGTVVNIGTLEHVWDVHRAWANSLRAVRVGGHFVTFSPVVGFDGHGIHVTGAEWIRAFVSPNGFSIVDEWKENKPNGRFKIPKERTALWLAAQKIRHVGSLDAFVKPQQIYKKGSTPWE